MTMAPDSTATSIVKAVTVHAPIAVAFDVFTTRFDTWWPRSHHIAETDMAEARIEPEVGGRWYEVGVDGSECEWGRVLAYDPPNHVAWSWHLTRGFTYDPDPERASRVDVRFTAISASETRVELTHSQLDRHGASWEEVRDGVGGEGGWPGLLDIFAAAANAA